MFHKFLSMLLCVCMLTGSISNAAYAMGSTMDPQIVDMEENAGAEFLSVATEEATLAESMEETTLATSMEETIEKELEAIVTEEMSEEILLPKETTEEELLKPLETEEVSTDALDEVDSAETVSTEEMMETQFAERLAHVTATAKKENELALDVEFTTKTKDYDTPIWLKYCVKKDGYYNLSLFYEGCGGDVYVFINDKDGMYEAASYVPANKEEHLFLYVEAGDVVYYMTFASSAGATMRAKLSEVCAGEAVVGEDGFYSVNAGDYTLTADVSAECSIADVDFWLTTDSDDILTGETYTVRCSVEELFAADSDAEQMVYSTIAGEEYNGHVFFGSTPPLKKNTFYSMQIVLMDYESLKPLVIFDGIEFKTKNTDQAAIFLIEDITSDSVTVMYEALIGGFKGYAYYGQEGTTERVHVMYGTQTYTGLLPNTTYRIWCEDFEGNILVEETFKTLDLMMSVSNASIECTGPSTALIKVDVDAYSGDASSLTLYFSYLDEDGKICTNYNTVDVEVDENGIKSAELELEIFDLIAGKTYVIDAWIQEENDPFSGKYHRFSKEITMPGGDFAAEDVHFFMSQAWYDPTTIEYTLKVNKIAKEEYVNVYYRIKDTTPEWVWNSYMGFTISDTSTFTGTIPDCETGVEYEVRLEFPGQGFSVFESCQMGENNYNPTVVADVDVFEANLTYSIPETEVTKEDEWTVSLGYIGQNRDDYFIIARSQVLNQENGYSVKINPLKDYDVALHPGKECAFIWYLYKNNVLCDVLKQSVTTKELTATFKQNSVGINEAAFEVDISARKENLGSGVTIDVSVEGAGKVHKEILKLTFDATGNAKQILKLAALLPNTEYTVKPLYEEEAFATMYFTTRKDDRTLSNLKVTPTKDTLYIEGKLRGTISESSKAYVYIYTREKGETLWDVGASSCWIFDRSDDNFSIDIEGLKNDTTYEYRVGIGNGLYTTSNYLTQVHEGKVTTFRDGRILTQKAVNTYLHSFSMKFNVSGETSKSQKNYVVVFYRKKNSADTWKKKYASVNGKGDVLVSVVSGLEKETTYEYVYGLGNKSNVKKDNLIGAKSGEFTTLADDRKITVDMVPYVDRAEARITLFGSAAKNIETPAGFYYKEKGSSTEYYYSTFFDGAETNIVKFDSLKEMTEYEYIAGIGDSKENLHQTVSGNFITKEDERKLVNVISWVGYESARIGATLINNNRNVDSCIHYFYREKGIEQWHHSFEWYGINSTSEDSISLEGLSSGTEYEYAVVLANTEEINSPDEITNKNRHITGTFKTKAGNYNFNITLNEAKLTHKQAAFEMTASGEEKDDRIYVTLEFTDGENVISKSVTLSQLLGYKNTFVLKGLDPATTYTLSALSFAVYENGKRIELVNNVPEVSFTTKETVGPEKIELSVDQLYLNAAGGGEYISEQTIKAEVYPQVDSDTYIWTSSDENVAVVSNGHIQAVGTGRAVIKVESVSNPAAADTCEVIVKNYVIAKKGDDGTPQIVTDSVSCNEGAVLSGYGLYKRATGETLEKLEDVKISVEKSLVAKWNESVLTSGSELIALGTGLTEVYFETGGIKAVMKVTVLKKSKAYGLTGLNTNNEAYRALLNEEGKYEIARKDGVTYTVTGEFVPQQTFDCSKFVWTSSNRDIATVDNGVITPLASGNVTITAVPKEQNSAYIQEKATVELIVKEVPEIGNEIPTVYAVTNTKKNMLLEDVAFPKEWGDRWKWRNPKTPLYTLPVNEESYAFEAYYDGEDKYAYEGLVNVYIGKLETVYAYENGANHNGVIQVSGKKDEVKDTIYLKLSKTHMGTLPRYCFSIPSVDGLSIEYDEVLEQYAVTAYESGNYVLTPVIEFFETDSETGKANSIYKLSGTYELKAVEAAQVADIKIVSEDADIEVDENGLIQLDFSEEQKDRNITLSAKVLDQYANELSTPVKWKTTDKSVVSVAYQKKASHQAVVTVKGEGHAVLTVSAADETSYETSLDVEIRNHKPRINTAKTTVNIAYDYKEPAGMDLAYNSYGAIELVEAYGNSIKSVHLQRSDGSEETQLKAECYSTEDGICSYIIKPTKTEIPKKKYSCQLVVTTEMGEKEYVYPLNVTVVDKAPKVTAKMGTKINLFYLNQNSNISFKTGNNAVIEKVSWVDASSDAQGFSVDSASYWNEATKDYRTVVSYEDVQLANRKLADTSIARGTLTVKLQGVRKPIVFNNFKIGYSYKKPSLKAISATSTISPATGNITSGFYIYDTLKKSNISYSLHGSSFNQYNELSYENDDVQVSINGSYVSTVYNGTKKQETVIYTLDSVAWRESLTVEQTIKTVTPKAVLKPSTLICNKAYKSTASTSIYLSNISTAEFTSWMDIEVIGDVKSDVLIQNDVLDITYTEEATSPILITLNQAKFLELEEELKAGTYRFKITPYYRHQLTGQKTKLKTLTLKVKIVDEPVEVKVTTKGDLDLTKSSDSIEKNSIRLKTKFNNLGDNYQVIGAKLCGEYSKYFKLSRRGEDKSTDNYYCLQIAHTGKVKANQKYKLSVEYTIQTSDGDTFKVESNVFTIRPKQSVPKISVKGNNQTLYTASDVGRQYVISVPEYYVIQSVSGGEDCNKDGIVDIAAEVSYMDQNTAVLNVSIKDEHAIGAAAKGKTYTIPLVIELKGRDGISKDAKVNIKVKVKR